MAELPAVFWRNVKTCSIFRIVPMLFFKKKKKLDLESEVKSSSYFNIYIFKVGDWLFIFPKANSSDLQEPLSFLRAETHVNSSLGLRTTPYFAILQKTCAHHSISTLRTLSFYSTLLCIHHGKGLWILTNTVNYTINYYSNAVLVVMQFLNWKRVLNGNPQTSSAPCF